MKKRLIFNLFIFLALFFSLTGQIFAEDNSWFETINSGVKEISQNSPFTSAFFSGIFFDCTARLYQCNNTGYDCREKAKERATKKENSARANYTRSIESCEKRKTRDIKKAEENKADCRGSDFSSCLVKANKETDPIKKETEIQKCQNALSTCLVEEDREIAEANADIKNCKDKAQSRLDKRLDSASLTRNRTVSTCTSRAYRCSERAYAVCTLKTN